MDLTAFSVIFFLLLGIIESSKLNFRQKRSDGGNKELDAEFWRKIGLDTLRRSKEQKINTNVAKNVILFLGDGMSLTTTTAARIYMGGEQHEISFEKFPHTAISKTYCVDKMVSESASTSTAYLGGVKGNFYTSGVTANVTLKDCEAAKNPKNRVSSIAEWSQRAGKRTGFVTTARLTHASPSGLYAHSAHKAWESDTDVINMGIDSKKCEDVGKQLIYGDVGKKFNVILGCGKSKLLPKEMNDENGKKGYRSDNLNLIQEWQTLKKEEKKKYEYVWNRKQLKNVRKDTDYLLGVFESGFCKYNVDRNKETEPSLTEMTESAINVLSKSSNGYFLFVEGGMIDQAHHSSLAGKALDETAEFAKAIQRATEITNEDDTLIVVTADHSHTLTMGSYPIRGSNILGISNETTSNSDGLPHLILNYANGPGYRSEIDGKRHNVGEDTIDMNYVYPALYPYVKETHGGEDVLVYAKGPWAHLYKGVMEQNTIPYIMAYASCVGDWDTACKDQKSGSDVFRVQNTVLIALGVSLMYLYGAFTSLM